MNEERLFILKMLEEGKISAQEAAALLDALEASDAAGAGEPAEKAGDAGKGGTTGPGAGASTAQPDGAAAEAASRAAGTGAGAGQAGPAEGAAREESGAGGRPEEGARRDRDDEPKWQEFSRDLGRQIREAIHNAMRGVPQIKEELKENFQEVREEVQHTIKEVREEIRKGPLVDVSGLVNLINNLFGRGPSHEVTDEVTGTWAEGVRPKLELRTRNGSVTVTGWNEPHYKVIIRKWVHAAGEEEAKRLAADAVHVAAGDDGLQVVSRDYQRVSVSIEAKVPKDRVHELLASSTNGAVVLEELKVATARTSTTNGAVRLRQVTGERIDAGTTNGRIACEKVHARELDLSTTNGAIQWDGSAAHARLHTTNGAIRFTPALPAGRGGAGEDRPGEPGEAQESVAGFYKASTTNAGIHVRLPDDPDVGVRFEARGRGVSLGVDDGRFVLENSSREFTGSQFIKAATPGYGEAKRRMELYLETTNGGIRLEGAWSRRDEEREPEGSGE